MQSRPSPLAVLCVLRQSPRPLSPECRCGNVIRSPCLTPEFRAHVLAAWPPSRTLTDTFKTSRRQQVPKHCPDAPSPRARSKAPALRRASLSIPSVKPEARASLHDPFLTSLRTSSWGPPDPLCSDHMIIVHVAPVSRLDSLLYPSKIHPAEQLCPHPRDKENKTSLPPEGWLRGRSYWPR